MKHNSRRNKATFSGSEQDNQTGDARQARPSGTRREFMKVAAGAGVALALVPGRHALASLNPAKKIGKLVWSVIV